MLIKNSDRKRIRIKEFLSKRNFGTSYIDSKLFCCYILGEYLLDTDSSHLEDRRAFKILDLGCGSGELAFVLNEVFNLERARIAVTGVDLVDSRNCKDIYHAFLQENITKLDLDFLKTFDLIIFNDGIEHLSASDAIVLVNYLLIDVGLPLILSTPCWRLKQGVEFGNENHRHLSFFDFLGMKEFQPDLSLITKYFYTSYYFYPKIRNPVHPMESRIERRSQSLLKKAGIFDSGVYELVNGEYKIKDSYETIRNYLIYLVEYKKHAGILLMDDLRKLYAKLA